MAKNYGTMEKNGTLPKNYRTLIYYEKNYGYIEKKTMVQEYS